ncbi:MAG: hypothetical protein IJO45_03390, partial [Oscillospiraceae bacterium]|nr:hypothetical protein [Oscillospiraceae bacterium]
QYVGGILLPPVQKLVATLIFAISENADKSLLLPVKQEDSHPMGGLFIWQGRDLKDLNRNMQVAYCCHQFKNWWLHNFSHRRKCRQIPPSPN